MTDWMGVDRRSKILGLVSESERVEVSVLAERFGVSQVTIRKDLDFLERQGLIRREHGIAEAIAPDNLLSRLAVHYDNKRSIARAAADLVDDDETVLIESGSCCALLAAELAATRRGITIVTNSAFIADYVRSGSAQVVLLGGDYQPESQVMVGPLIELCAGAFHASKLFFGIDGFADGKFTGRNLARAAAVQVLARRADEVIVLSESLKFGRKGVVSLLPAADVNTVVTDASLPEALHKQLAEAAVTVVTPKIDFSSPPREGTQ